MFKTIQNPKLKIKTGKKGEDIANCYLKERGYKILEKNYRTRYAEIDIIAQKENRLVFVEVRTKKDELYGSPEETLNQVKLKKLCRNAKSYVNIQNWQGQYQIDAICVVLDRNNKVRRIQHYKNIIN